MHGRFASRMIGLGLVAAVGCGGSSKTLGAKSEFEPQQLECTIDGEPETRVTRDCSTELSYQERRIGARLEILGQKIGADSEVQFRPVENSLAMLLEQQRGLCRDWNACAVDRKEYVERSEWLTSQFSTLSQLLESADPSTMNDDAARQQLVQRILEWAERAQQHRIEEKVESAEIEAESRGVQEQARGNEILSDRAQAEAEHSEAVGDRAAASVRKSGASQLEAAASGRQAGALDRQADTVEERAALRAAMAQRAAEARERVQASSAESRARVRAQLMASIEQYRQRQSEMEALEPLLKAARKQSAGLTEGQRPRMCSTDLQAKLSKEGRSGSAVAGQARSLAKEVERICERFDDWTDPPSEIRRQLRRIGSTVDRAEKMASDFSVSTNEPREVADKILAAIRVARRELEGVAEGRKRFPCTSSNWSRLRELQTMGNQWAGAAARRVLQLEGRVCNRLGVSPARLKQAHENFMSSIERANRQVRTQSKQYDELIEQMKAHLPEEAD